MIKKVLNDNILLEVEIKEQQTNSGIIIPDSASDKQIQTGRIAFVGEGRLNDKGERSLMSVKTGDLVLFEKGYNSQEVKIDEKTYLKISESDIIAILE
ncbi:MAG: co-chaperone GroES [Candidatus Pacebacteria bacterium]|nr:co-chaperone GroES [Candidatus Paceibacterota bacterium]